MTTLLDVNVLLALAWSNHQHHAAALRWFERNAANGWATCALTELGFARLSSNPAYTEAAVTPLEAIELLGELREIGKHSFIKSMPGVLALEHLPLLGHRQLTDALLVVLAEEQRARLVTLDAALKQYARRADSVVVLPTR